jgi:hypothetical protein
VRAAGLLVVLASAACVRAPAEAVCPELAPGEMVVTEIRGPQMPEDAAGAWVELYNASGRRLDLAGLELRFRRVDDSGAVSVLVRRALDVRPGGYTVLGLFDDADPPAHVDYGFLPDFRVGWLPRAAVEVGTCGTVVDRMFYDVLPQQGTYSLGGVPDAVNNDLQPSWCNDATLVGTASPGTPRSANIACP